jgi:Tol biopolymer transport system component
LESGAGYWRAMSVNVQALGCLAGSPVCRGLVALALASASGAVAASFAEASYPGRNGLLAVSRFAPGQATTIWLVDPRTGQARQLTRVPRRCRGAESAWQDSDPAFSASGRFVVYLHIEFDFPDCHPRRPSGIYVIRTDGRGRRRLPVSSSGANPAFSPSGRLLAFDEGGSIFIRDLERRPPARELSDPRPSLFRQWSAPSWSQAGRLALTVGPTVGARGHIATVQPNGGDFRLVTRSVRDQEPDWSPQGNRIVFARVNDFDSIAPGGSDILVARSRARRHERPKRLTHTRDGFSPTWSPDGRGSAFVRDTPEPRSRRRLAIMSARGDRQRQLPVDDKLNSLSRISWQPLPR